MASPVGVVDKLLPRQPGKRERVAHHPAMPWRDVPAFFLATLRTQPVTLSKLMLEILILTAVRSGELRHMTWDEVDLEKAVWTIPASRMKAKSVHRVPLAPRVVTLLRLLKPRREGLCQEKRPGGPGLLHFAGESNLVFPSRNGTATSDMILTKLLRDRKVASDVPGRHATAHGFRSSFRDWASENGYARDLAERALAHTISNAAEAAYHRTDLLEQRRSMMEAWAHFCTGQCMVVE